MHSGRTSKVMSKVTFRVLPSDGLALQPNRRAVVGVSLNSRTAISRERLRDILQWTATHIGECEFLVGDYLNRHNYEALEGLSASEAIARTRRDGASVIARLHELIQESSIPATVISSESLYTEPTFMDRVNRFNVLHQRDERFRLLIDEAIDAFLARKRRAIRQDPSIRDHCVAYQLEELAMFELLAESGRGTLVYGGAHLPIMKAMVSQPASGISVSLSKLTLVELAF
jgi:tRNA-dependent cyclodipeptide synthase